MGASDPAAVHAFEAVRAVDHGPELVPPLDLPPAPSGSLSNRNLPTWEMPPDQSASADEGPSFVTWLLRVVAIIVVAFVLGAGAAVAWIQLLR